MDVVFAIVAIAACVGMLVLAYRLQPHWVSKDGRRFLCTGQQVDRHGNSGGRAHEVWVTVADNGALLVDRRRFGSRRGSPWTMEGRADDTARQARFVLRSAGSDDRLVLRMPLTSRAIPVLDALDTG